MTLYILGNGFDLAHKLPTAYWDFRTYLKSAHPEFLEAFEEHYDIYPSMSDEAKKEYLWNRFESNLANIDEDKEKLKLVNSLVTAGIDRKRIRTIPSGEFFDLDDTAAAHRITELRYRF